MPRNFLTDDWQESLDECERNAVDAPPRSRWLYRVRTRVYRMLLAMHGTSTVGPEEWNLKLEPLPHDEDSAVFVAEDEEDAAPAKPVKTKAQILQALKHISASNEPAPIGDYTASDVKSEWFLVADVRKEEHEERITRRLRRARIYFVRRQQGNHRQILVRPSDRFEANRVIAELRATSTQYTTHEVRTKEDKRRSAVSGIIFGATFLFFCGAFVFGTKAFLIPREQFADRSQDWLLYLTFAIYVVFGFSALALEWYLRERCIPVQKYCTSKPPAKS